MKKCTIKNYLKVHDKLMKYVSEDQETYKQYVEAFNELLDDLLNQDFFGTEGQCDPRGDHRG